MRAERFIEILLDTKSDPTDFLRIRRGIPLGETAEGALVFSRLKESPYLVKHTAVTGVERTQFIKRLIILLSALYKEEEASFLILSPKTEYTNLMRLKGKDVNVIYIRTKEDLESGKKCLRDLLDMRKTMRCPRLFVVLDGLEDMENCNQKGELEEYREILEMARGKDVEIITGADLIKSIFSGYPGAFVDVGNCLITTCGAGKADVTYVGEDASLSLPTALVYPNESTIDETIAFVNTLAESV